MADLTSINKIAKKALGDGYADAIQNHNVAESITNGLKRLMRADNRLGKHVTINGEITFNKHDVDGIRDKIEYINELKGELNASDISDNYKRSLEEQIKRHEYNLVKDGRKHLVELTNAESKASEALKVLDLEKENVLKRFDKVFDAELKKFDKFVASFKDSTSTQDFAGSTHIKQTTGLDREAAKEMQRALRENRSHFRTELIDTLKETKTKYQDVINEVNLVRTELDSAGVKASEILGKEASTLEHGLEAAAKEVKGGGFRGAITTVIGAAVGAFIGHQFDKEDSKVGAIVGGGVGGVAGFMARNAKMLGGAAARMH